MGQTISRGSILTGLVVVGTLVAGGREAPGAATTILVKGGVIQVGDPQYTYELAVYLTGGTIDTTNPTSFSLTGLDGVDSASAIQVLYQDPNLTWSSLAGSGSGTWTLTSGSESVADTLLGDFQVTSDPTIDLPPGYPDAVTYFAYSASFDGQTQSGDTSPGGGLSLAIGGVFPEPSTLTYGLCAIASMAVLRLVMRRGSRRTASAAH